MDVLYSSDSQFSAVRKSLFDPQFLQFDLTNGVPAGKSVLDVVQTWPIINQLLYTAMIVQGGDQVYGGDSTHQYLWFPGAVPCSDSSPGGSQRVVYCVGRIDSRTPDGAETITWVPIVEEITSAADAAANVSPFSVSSPEGGLVALRVNYGYQSAAMTRLPPPQTWPPAPNDPAWGAHDPEVTANSANYTPIGAAPLSAVGTYSGPYGLGTQEAWAGLQRTDPVVPPPPPLPSPPAGVRPYRSLISAQAIYRREVFQ